MKKQAFNPYLPSYEYVPDAEPYVFGNRLYVYGSHDAFGGKGFCVNDYVCYSAPTDDLGNWKYEGVIYRRTQDPVNPKGRQYMNAPDVCRGTGWKILSLLSVTDAEYHICCSSRKTRRTL